MSILRPLARPLLASMFIAGGVNALRNAPMMAAKAAPVAELAQSVAPQIPLGPVGLVRTNAVVDIAAGAALATGRAPRISAAVLFASLVPTTAVGHQFWNETDKVSRNNQQIHFIKNLSMAGGLLFAVMDKPAKKNKKSVKKKAKRAK